MEPELVHSIDKRVVRLEGSMEHIQETLTQFGIRMEQGFQTIKDDGKRQSDRRWQLILWIVSVTGTAILAGIIALLSRVYGQ